MVDQQVIDEANRILAGRPPSGDKGLLNRAIDFIATKPELRRTLEGGRPTGLTLERQEAFRQQQIQSQGLSRAERERQQALGQIAQAQPSPRDQALQVVDPRTGEVFKSVQAFRERRGGEGVFKQEVIRVQEEQQKREILQARREEARKPVPKFERAGRRRAEIARQEVERKLAEQEARARRGPTGEIQRGPEPPAFERFIGEEETKFLRGQPTVGQRFGAGVTTSFVGTAEFGVGLVTEPVETLKQIPSSLKQVFAEVKSGELLAKAKADPFFTAGFIGAELITLKGGGKVIKTTTKTGKKVTTRLSPLFEPVEKGGVRVARTGEFLEFQQPVSQIKTSLKAQAEFSGKEIQAVSGALDFFKPLRRKVKVQKPGVKGVQASFFADPFGKLRVSRLGLGVQEEASLLDILGGRVTFRGQKAQAIIFPKVKVAKLPKDIARTLKQGRTLSPSQARRLEKFQLEITGEFKPIGALSLEPEVTLPVGEIIKKKRKLGVTLFEGKPLSLIEAEIGTPTKELGKLIVEKQRVGKLSKTKQKRLESLLEKETGFSKDISLKARISKSARAGELGLTSKIRPLKPSRPSVGKPLSEPTSPSLSPEKTSPRLARSPFDSGLSPRRALRRGRQPSPIFKPSPRGRGPLAEPIATIPAKKRKVKARIPKKKKRQLTEEKEFEDALIFTPGFTERVLGVKRKVTRTKFDKEVREGGFALRRRATPIFIKEKKKRGKPRIGID